MRSWKNLNGVNGIAVAIKVVSPVCNDEANRPYHGTRG